MEKKQQAAKDIQAIQRGKADRQSIAEKKKIAMETDKSIPELDETAQKVQAVVRGKTARVEMEKKQQAAKDIQAVQRGKMERQHMEEKKKIAESTNKTIPELEESAQKVQAVV